MVRALSSLVTLAAAATVSGPLALNAPADVYFGPFKYSAISTRTKIDALARSYQERWADDASLVHDAGMVESALLEWAKRYPHDHWLPATGFHLAQLYMEIQTPEARAHAKAMFRYVARTFPTTPQGHLARLRLQQGFPALHDESPVAPTPSPYGPASPAAGAANPAQGAAATPAPSPASSASPVASATPAAAMPAGSPGPRSATPAPVPIPRPSPARPSA